MSAIIVLTVGIPAASAAWPVVAAAAVSAGAALGFTAVQAEQDTKTMNEVEVTVRNSQSVTGEIPLGEEIVLSKGGVKVVFSRDTNGQVAVKVSGSGKSDAELRAIGQEMADKLVQQYAYHRLVTELKQQNFNVVDEAVEEDGTVRLQVRTFK